MDFIQHTLNWVKGEIIEATIMTIFGFLIVLCGFLLWKFGTTPYAKALIIPLVIVGIIPIGAGVSGIISNKKRIRVYKQSYAENPKAFIQAEKERVEGFDDIFKYSYPAAVIFTIGGAILFFLISSPTWKGMSLALITLGLTAYFIDYFASERATIYLKYIENAIDSVM